MDSIQDYLLSIDFKESGQAFVRDFVTIPFDELALHTLDTFRRKAIDRGWITAEEVPSVNGRNTPALQEGTPWVWFTDLLELEAVKKEVCSPVGPESDMRPPLLPVSEVRKSILPKEPSVQSTYEFPIMTGGLYRGPELDWYDRCVDNQGKVTYRKEIGLEEIVEASCFLERYVEFEREPGNGGIVAYSNGRERRHFYVRTADVDGRMMYRRVK